LAPFQKEKIYVLQRGDSWPPLPRVELIQKVSTNSPSQ